MFDTIALQFRLFLAAHDEFSASAFIRVLSRVKRLKMNPAGNVIV